jgi:glycosyltransferase involved in cell wall biosynthesis
LKRLAVITTHPIQYYAPVFQLLHRREKISLKVFYTWGEAALKKFDPGFGKVIDWDVPLLENYDFEWVNNIAADPGSHHFNGIVNPGLIQQVNSWQPDAVLVFGWAYKSHLNALRYFKNRLPVYFRGDSTLLDEKNGIKLFLKSIFLKWVYKHADHAFYTGTNNKAYFEKYGLTGEQLSFAPHAIDNTRFEIMDEAGALNIRNNAGIKSDEIVILFAGKLEEKKLPGLILDAFIALNDPDVHLLFAGDGILEEELKANTARNKNVHFIGFQNQSQMPAVYQACNLFCLPSKGPGETWGLAVNEAMACGKPVLVSDKCGCAIDLVTDDNGRIFKSENKIDLIGKLKELIAVPQQLVLYGKRSKIMIHDWNFANIAQVIEKKVSQLNGQ